MTSESEIIARLRRIATDPAARGLLDDAAVFEGLVITHDSIAEGVHFLPFDPPASVGWKLVAVNLSDLAAKGAAPAAALLSLTLSGDGDWEAEFIGGIEAACDTYGLPLIGGDTIALPAGTPRVLGLTAIGRAGAKVPDRAPAASPATACGWSACLAMRARASSNCARTRMRPDRWSMPTAGRFRCSPPGRRWLPMRTR